jgi:hypothetical protein
MISLGDPLLKTKNYLVLDEYGHGSTGVICTVF